MWFGSAGRDQDQRRPAHNDTFTKKLTPQGIGLVIVHDKGVHDELSRYAESVLVSIDEAGIAYPREAERSPCDGNRLASNHVINDLVATHHLDGIRLVLAANRDAKYWLVRGHRLVRFKRGDEFGFQNRRDRVSTKQGDEFEIASTRRSSDVWQRYDLGLYVRPDDQVLGGWDQQPR